MSSFVADTNEGNTLKLRDPYRRHWSAMKLTADVIIKSGKSHWIVKMCWLRDFFEHIFCLSVGFGQSCCTQTQQTKEIVII